jgi:hypothetical protein
MDKSEIEKFVFFVDNTWCLLGVDLNITNKVYFIYKNLLALHAVSFSLPYNAVIVFDTINSWN